MVGKKYTPEELDKIEKSINVPIKKAIQKKYYTPEKKAILDTLRAQKKVPEFRAIAEKIKSDINFEWENNTDKLYMDDEKRKAYTTLGGVTTWIKSTRFSEQLTKASMFWIKLPLYPRIDRIVRSKT